MLQDRKIKIGVVGCGKIASNHFKSIAELSHDYELQCICDTHPATLEGAMSTMKRPGYATIDAMLDAEPDLDLVTLCSPSGLHAAQTIRIAKAQKHVITEKPMATRWTDGIDMVNACDAANVQLFVVKQNRYQPALQLLRD